MRKLALGIGLTMCVAGCFESEDDGGGGSGGALSEDCTSILNDAPECASNAALEPGAFGGGPLVSGLNLAAYNGGFIDGSKLIVGLEYGPDSDRKGAVVSIDLSSGDRAIISGTFSDPASGDQVTGEGREFGAVKVVRKGPDGMYYALNSPTSADEVEIYRVDPTSGDRTLVWADDARDDLLLADGSEEDLNAPAVDDFADCVAGDNIIMEPFWPGFAVDGEGNFYLTLRNAPTGTGRGIIKISADGQSCTPFSVSDATIVDPIDPNVGSGPAIGTGDLRSMRIVDGALWATNPINKSLFKFDLATGDRTRVSSSSSSFKVGEGNELAMPWLSWDADRGKFITAGTAQSITLVDPETGDREVVDLYGAAGKSGVGVAFGHPTNSSLLVAVAGDAAIAVVDPADGNSNNISY